MKVPCFYIFFHTWCHITCRVYLYAVDLWVAVVEVEREAVRDSAIRWQTSPKSIDRDHLVTVVWSQHTGH